MLLAEGLVAVGEGDLNTPETTNDSTVAADVDNRDDSAGGGGDWNCLTKWCKDGVSLMVTFL